MKTINCQIYVDGEFQTVPCKAELYKQNILPDIQLYITYNHIANGYALTEFKTGFCISGDYPESTKRKASAWLIKRAQQMGTDILISRIKEQQNKHPTLNN